MASLKYTINQTTTQDRETLANGIAHIQFPTNEHVWIVQNPQKYETIVIKFDIPCKIKDFIISIKLSLSLDTKSCSQVKISLYNITDDSVKIQLKQLETVNFITQNQQKKIQNPDFEDNTYQFAEITFYSQNNELSIKSLQVLGQSGQNQTLSQYALQSETNHMKQQFRPSQFPLIKSSEKESLIIVSDLKINPTNQISQRSAQMVQKSQQFSLFNKTQQQKKQQNHDKQSEDFQLQRAFEESIKTHKKELQKQEQQELEIEKQIDDMYCEEEKDNNNKRHNLQSSYDSINKQLDEALLKQQRFSQPKSIVKQQLFSSINEENNDVIKVQIMNENQMSEQEYEEMIQYHSNMVNKDFVQYHKALEESFFKGTSLFEYMNQQFKPLQYQHVYIVKDALTDFEYKRLELKVINFGGTVVKQVTNKTTIIISDKPIQVDNKKFNICVLSTKLLESCSIDKWPQFEKYEVK
ncbi:unnamed protein product (macronuclear) [Paramecium tetraurelia]|uniref:BRCT domain-containing protein n=1 Tax=Paramecium tetraurelia TaxID=5888 RepID=A0DXL3_PARTE|nr:uncharacterized protein GSPATT00021404001 [Paramecium tetraurelia]CAK87780.1 unnamed protein product [Paramecium tetraurelia]|eukprot:XP_001455177.1 hypothetical protein (macronuclear) [Paramecium tetraurelia strain d4-2]